MDDKTNGAAALDLAAMGSSLKRAQEEGIRVEIRRPDSDEPLGLSILVAGPDSDRQKAARNKIIDERLAKKVRSSSAKLLTDETMRVLAASVISWDWSEGVTFNGSVPECTPKNVEELFRTLDFVREQVEAEAGERRGFTKS